MKIITSEDDIYFKNSLFVNDSSYSASKIVGYSFRITTFNLNSYFRIFLSFHIDFMIY